MILLVSGEGPSDIGSRVGPTGEASGDNFKAGPMALIIDRLVEPIWTYSPLAASALVFISEQELDNEAKNIRGMKLPGPKSAKGTALFGKQARALAMLAKARTTDMAPVGAVLFHDTDGTRSDPKTLWKDKTESIEKGFEAEDFSRGVPMVPKPKSEAWLLCAAQENAYNNCARFEDLSGNDASPQLAKGELEKALNARGRTYGDVCDMVESGEINPQQIKMPSFDYFRDRLETVARQMMRR